jgi:type VI secretion system Hcp family effector
MSLRLRTWTVLIAGLVGIALAMSVLGIGHNGGLTTARAGGGETPGEGDIGEIFVKGVISSAEPSFVRSWSFDATNHASSDRTGVSSNKPKFQNVEITKRIDKSSPLLLNAMALRKPIAVVKLSLYDTATGGADIDNPVIILNGAVVSDIEISQDDPDGVETVSFAYSKITYEYNKDDDHSSVCWDLGESQKC